MVKKYQLVSGKIVEDPEGTGQICVYVNPDDNERRLLIDDYKIDEHTLQSALDPNELARVEFEPEHVALITKRPKRYNAQDNFLFKVESVGLFMFSDRLVVLLSEEIPIWDGRQFVRMPTIQDVVTRLIYRSIFHFEEHLKVIAMCSDELERQVNSSMENRHLLNMFTLEKSLVFYLNAIGSNGRAIDKLKGNIAKIGFSTANQEYLDDLAIENAQCYEMAQIYSQVLSGLMDARASLISNNLNVMMKNLNAVVIAVAVPSFFAGMGGMSEFSAMIGFNHWKFGYPIFLGVMLLVGISTFFLIKKAERLWKEP